MKISLFPKEKNTIKLNVPKEIIIKELARYIDIGGFSIILYNKGKKFSGKLSGEKAEIRLKTTYRNSFKPKINISLFKDENTTIIVINYEIELFVKIFMIIFIIPLLLMQAGSIYLNYEKLVNKLEFYYFIPIIILAGILFMSRFFFYMSLGQSEAELNKIFIRIRNKYKK